ncbi:MAG: FxsA family protein [Nitrospirota bacterium]|nr:MAG: FxsA family protein [Nitrospirota bacterium]
MFLKLFLIFAILPIVELSLLIKIGTVIGTINTIAIVILTAIVGAYMVRMEGIGVWFRIQKSLAEGIFPADELISGIMILVAGAVLLTPGFVTDAIGFLMVFPYTREHIKRLLKKYFEKRITTIHIQ